MAGPRVVARLPVTWFSRRRTMLEHVKLIEAADISFPIILSSSGAVMDGRHRVAKAALLGHAAIAAVQFDKDPEPDYVGRGPDELPSLRHLTEQERQKRRAQDSNLYGLAPSGFQVVCHV